MTNPTPAHGNRPKFSTGQQVVASAGTPVQLNGGTTKAIPPGYTLLIRALASNTKNIGVSDTIAHATYTNNTCDILTPGSVLGLDVTDVSLVYIDSQVSGEGVSWAVEQ